MKGVVSAPPAPSVANGDTIYREDQQKELVRKIRSGLVQNLIVKVLFSDRDISSAPYRIIFLIDQC